MNKNFAKLLLVAALMASGFAKAAPLPEGIIKQLPKEYSVLSYRGGELDDDKRIDFLVVLRRSDEKPRDVDDESIDETFSAPARPLLLFLQNKDGSYSLVRRNDHVVFKIDESGQCDPFEDGVEGLAINKHYFTFQNNVACGQHWSDYITFRYDPKLRDWVFHKRVFEDWVINYGKDSNELALVLGTQRVDKGKGKQPVLFEDYRAK